MIRQGHHFCTIPLSSPRLGRLGLFSRLFNEKSDKKYRYFFVVQA